jgi:ankyrin repeat protein
MYWGCQYPQWPVELQNNGYSRSEYIKSLKCADQGDYDPLIAFMQNLGINNPSLSELLGLATYKDKLTNPQRLAIVKASLKMGCQVNETKNKGYHPLHTAIKKGYDEVALILLQHGADITYRDRSGYDPLELAISLTNMKLAEAIHKAGYS